MGAKRIPDERRRIADRLALASRSGFVGRARECALFRDALNAEGRPSVLWVHGTGGVGKTTLLREFSRLAVDAGRPVVALDARHVEPSRRGLLQAFAEALARDVPDPAHIPIPDSAVVFIDTFERLRGLESWIRDALLPHLPASALFVLAGRDRPAAEWQTDVAWAPLTRIVELQNFAESESTAFLTSRGVAASTHPAVLAFTHGHPLALSLIADVIASAGTEGGFDPAAAPDVIQHLLALFLETVPAAFRDALDVASVARVTSERLLTDLFGTVDGRSAFDWLRAQPFVESSPAGLFPHDLAREVLLADARWRNPDRLRILTRRVYSTLHTHIGSARGRERQRLQMDALYVTRTTPTNVVFFDWRNLDDVFLQPAEAHEHEWILSVIDRHEGPDSAALARAWLRAQPEAFHVCRGAGDRSFGLVAMLDIGSPGVKDLSDPAVDAAMSFVARHAPVKPAEGVVHLRWWMHADAYQAVTAAINLAAMHVVSHCVTRPGLAWNFVSMSNPAFWAEHFAGVNFARVPEADFEIGGRRYGVFAHEWRIDPPADWLMATRTAMPFGDRVETTDASPLLGEAEFLAAVRTALRDYTRPGALAANALRSSSLLHRETDPEARARALQHLLRQAAETLDTNPRDQKLFRVVRYTYLEPLATQEAVAERLDLPFSTYRHQLGRAIDRIGAWLWLRERAQRRG